MLLCSTLAAALLLLAAAPVAASAADCPHGGDLVTALSSTGSPRRAALRPSTPSARRAVCPWSARADSSRARRRRHSDDMVVRRFFAPCHARRLDARRSGRGDRLHRGPSRLGARRGDRVGPATARHARQPHARVAGQPRAPRDHPRSAFRDVGIGITPGLTDGSDNPRRHPPCSTSASHGVAYAAAMALGDNVRGYGAQLAADARSVRIDLDALEALDPGRSPQLDPQRHYLEGPARRCRRLPPVARRDQLRLGLVPDAAQARRAARATSPSPWSLADRFRAPARVDRRAAARDAHRRAGRDARPAARPRADGALRPGPARARRASSASPRARRRRPARRIGRSGSPSAGRRHDALSTTAASTSARRSPRTTSRWPASRSSTTSTGSRSSPTTSSPTCCAATASSSTTTAWRRTSTPGGCCATGPQEREIRACALHACELIARARRAARELDMWLWNRGQAPVQGAAAAPLPHLYY